MLNIFCCISRGFPSINLGKAQDRNLCFWSQLFKHMFQLIFENGPRHKIGKQEPAGGGTSR